MLKAVALSCSKKDRLLFSDLHLQLVAGELLYLRGANGAGKTSLMRIIVGLSAADCGQVLFNDTPIEHNSEFLQQLIFIGHKTANTGQLSAVENLHFWCAQQGIHAAESRLLALLADLGLAGLEYLPVNQLSAGQQRRVALARLWLKPAALWVLDEPYTALDAAGVGLLNQHIQAHLKQGGAVLLTSHQPPVLECVINTLDLEYQI